MWKWITRKTAAVWNGWWRRWRRGLHHAVALPVWFPTVSVGQDYTRLFVDLKTPDSAQCVEETLPHIYVGLDRAQNAVYISPLNLNENEQKLWSQH